MSKPAENKFRFEEEPSRRWNRRDLLKGAVAATTCLAMIDLIRSGGASVPQGREPVIFWHFWGGEARRVISATAARFNSLQRTHWVVEIPIPGQNLDMKFFMSVAGGSVPDLINQDDQVVAQWAEQGILHPIRSLSRNEQEYQSLLAWLNPPSRRIGTYNNELYAVCNAVDIRAMFYRRSALDHQPVPTTLSEFDRLALIKSDDPATIPFLPDDRRLWAWAIAFGGSFYDEAVQSITANAPQNIAALQWMQSYTRFHGVQNIQAFRSTNRESGSGSMLLDGRYQMMLDGQWRVAELDAVQFHYEVGPLPSPTGGRENAGWVNGNFFLVPSAARNPAGAWEFIKFWTGFHRDPREAALTAAAGGWIPPSPEIVAQPEFQHYLKDHPRFRLFVELAQSENQFPTPAIASQAYYFDRVNQGTEQALLLKTTPATALAAVQNDVIKNSISTIA